MKQNRFLFFLKLFIQMREGERERGKKLGRRSNQ